MTVYKNENYVLENIFFIDDDFMISIKSLLRILDFFFFKIEWIYFQYYIKL